MGATLLAVCAAISCSKDDKGPEKENIPDLSTVSLSEINGAKDFIELYNAGDAAVSLKGAKIRRLRMNDGEEDKQTLWEGTTESIGPKAYLCLRFKEGNLKKEFSARKNAYFWLQDAAKNTVSEFTRGQKSIGWNQIHMQRCQSAQEEVYSYARIDGKWVYALPTPGEPNGSGVGAIDQTMMPVVINEIDFRNNKVELFNNSEKPINIIGYQLRWGRVNKQGLDDNRTIWAAEEETVIPANGFLVVETDSSLCRNTQTNFHLRLRDGSEAHVDFTGAKYVSDELKRGKKGEGWNLITMTSALVGNMVRVPDGTGDWYMSNTPSLGATNGMTPGKPAPDIDGY